MTKQRPNVVFVITDDQGYGDLGCTGNVVVKTPNIDRLYGESVRFTDYHVGPTCAPTRAGLMTGHYHNSTGVWHTIGGRSLLRKDEISLADVFRENGYKTALFGKWHLGDNYPYRPHDRGFDEAIIHGGGGIGQTPDYWGNDYFDDTYYDKGFPKSFKGYCTDVFFRLGMDFIKRNQESPFFCMISTNAPHIPLQVKESYYNIYKDTVDDDRARFYGMITNIDDNVGKLRTFLSDTGLEENTIFIFMTDNGTYNGCDMDCDHYVTGGYNAGMRGIKGSPYEGGHRVPFFLRWPCGGFSSASDIKELTANIDFMPTMIDLCNLRYDENLSFDGKSLRPLMEGKPTGWKDRIIITDSQRVPDPVMWKDSCVMQNSWRLVNKTQLYDIYSDPEERNNISDKYGEVVQKLSDAYEDWWAKVSKRFEEEIPISIGSDKESVTRISTHDWRGDAGDCAWNQGEIRRAKVCNSYAEILVEESGYYRFELRRWPQEETRKMTQGIPGKIKDWFTGGIAVPINKASIQIRDISHEKGVMDDDDFVAFDFYLEKGPAHLKTCLYDSDGNQRGAYYVYVSKQEN